jgi:phospholipid/cholesterol/gamma-HCH transport system substrate-binding protein
VRRALRKYSRDFVALIVLIAVGLATLVVLLSQQSAALPTWLPILGEDKFELKAEFQTSQAVTPGQGQTVNLAGVKVGDVSGVELVDGVAVVSMDLDPDYAQLIHPNASALLRPRTGLQDMTIELDPGSGREEVAEGFTIPLANTEPNVNFDQILASLDGDTRTYLRLLLAGGAEALGTRRKSEEFASLLRRFQPTTRDIAKITDEVGKRRRNIARVVTNFKLIAEELARSDTNLTGFIETQNEVFGAFAEAEQSLRASLRELPSTLRETREALDASSVFAGELSPALTALTPQAEALGPALRATRPMFERTLPSIRDQLRPFTRQVRPFTREVKKVAAPLADSTGRLGSSLTELNQILNALAYQPPGQAEGYLFYMSWLNHNTNASFLNQDGMGPLRRSLVTYTCTTSRLADNVVLTRPVTDTLRKLTRLPTTAEICPPLPFGLSAEQSERGEREPGLEASPSPEEGAGDEGPDEDADATGPETGGEESTAATTTTETSP